MTDLEIVEKYAEAKSICERLHLFLTSLEPDIFWLTGPNINFQTESAQALHSFAYGILKGYELKEKELQNIKDIL